VIQAAALKHMGNLSSPLQSRPVRRFSKAFKREMGIPSGLYRKEQVSSVIPSLRS
jgi:hypothetical protein